LNDNLLSETFEVGISKLSFPLFVLGVWVESGGVSRNFPSFEFI
jgi:hypothetical protein